MSRLFLTFVLLSCLFPNFQSVSASSSEVDYYTPQNILKFADYLYRQGDYLRAAGEYQRYLFVSATSQDTTLYKIGLCYRRRRELQRAIGFFQRIGKEYPENRLLTQAHYQIGCCYFLMGQYNRCDSYLGQVLNKLKEENSRCNIQRLLGFSYLKQRRWTDAASLFDSMVSTAPEQGPRDSSLKLKRYAEQGKSLPHKSPVLAGLLATVLPGAGKIYCNRYGDGFYSFLLVGGTAWRAHEGFHKDGLKSTGGWIFGTLSGIFYLGNIYGSVVAAQIYNRLAEDEFQAKIQMDIEMDWLN